MKSEIRLKVDRLGERHELRRCEADAGKASDQRIPEKRTVREEQRWWRPDQAHTETLPKWE
jgi:hypothetical protein